MSDSSPSIGKVITTSTTFVDKAVEFRHFMLLISFILALDSSLMIFFRKNLAGAFSNLGAPEVSAGNALIFLGGFAFLMAVLFPVLRELILLVGDIVTAFRPSKRSSNPDYQSPLAVMRTALIERDKVAVEEVGKHQQLRGEHQTNMKIGFAMALLFAFNWLALGDSQHLTVTQTAAALPGSLTGFWVNFLAWISKWMFVVFAGWVFWLSITPDQPERIYMPESDERRKLREETTARRLGV